MQKSMILFVLMNLLVLNSFGQYNRSLVQKAENGQVSAQMELAKCYLDGNGIDQSQSEAVRWYESAAEKGNIEAMVACGDLYCDEWNIDLEPDYVKGIKWYRKAAAKGDKKAKDYISNFESSIKKEGVYDECPFTWLPCDEDFERSDFLKQNLDVINKEFSNKNPVAAYYLAILAYVNGDFTSVVKYLTEIYPVVMNEDNYFEDILGHDEDSIPIGATLPVKVFSLLGWCYEYGQGVETDYIKAADYYLSEFYYSDLGMSMIPRVRGAYCYKKAGIYDKFINQVNSQGIGIFNGGSITNHLYVPCLKLELAEMYKTGKGIAQNKNKALEIYESIVDQRKFTLEWLMGWYPEIRSYSDIGKAAYRASQMYRKGYGCKADEEMADLYFEIAMKYGDKNAWYDNQNK